MPTYPQYVPSTNGGGPGGVAATLAAEAGGYVPQPFNENPGRVQFNSAAQLANQASILEGFFSFPVNAISQPVNVTGVTLSTQGIPTADLPNAGLYALAFVFVGTLLAFDGGATQNVSGGGLFTLVSGTGKKIKAYVVAASLPGANQSDANIQVGQNVTGVVLSLAGIIPSLRPTSGSKTLSYTSAGTLLAWDGGLAVNVGAGGTFTLTGQDGRTIKAVVTVPSLPASNKSDSIQIYQGAGIDGKEIFWVQFNTASTFLQGTQFQSLLSDFNAITQPVNTTGVVLNFNGIVQASRLVEGLHSLAFTFVGTLLAIDGGTGVNVGAGGTFTLTAPNGKTVKAVVAAASIPGGNTADSITVSSFVTASKVRTDPTPKIEGKEVYAAL